LWEADRARAIAALATVGRVARESHSELLRSLDLLDTPATPSIAAPGLRDLDGLLQNAELAGLHLDLRVDGEKVPLSARVELAAYRVVQEALTNVIKHAPNASARVSLRYGNELLDLEIVNTLPVAVGSQQNREGGQGLLGMRDRVAACGGHLEWGRSGESEFALRAQLPLKR
jgi:signal transduction histidine kinase